MEREFKSKYHRKEPIREFNVDQTLYNAVMNTNEKNMNYNYAQFFGKTMTFGELKFKTDCFATALKRDGVLDEEKVGVALLTVPEVSSTLLALSKIGATSYWIDVTAEPANMIHYINDHKLKKIIISEPLVPMLEKIIDMTTLDRVIVVPISNYLGIPQKKEYSDERIVDFHDYTNVIPDQTIVPVKYDKEKPTVIVQSSGSTGSSKSIVHTDYNLNNEIQKMAYADLPFYETKRSFVCAPPWVIYGLVNSIYSGLLFSNQTVFSLKPEEDMLYKHLGEYDFVYGVPVYYRYLYNKILKLEKSNKLEDMKELKHIMENLEKVDAFISGGSKIPEDELIDMQQKFGISISNGYGNNESVGAAIVSPRFANRPGSIGVPMYGNIVKAFDPETCEPLKEGEIGEIWIGSDSLFKEYLDNPEETQKIKVMYNGIQWIKSGDLGYIDADGYVFLKGRTRRLIIDKLGYKISPDNSENIISSLDSVNECVVVGVEVAEHDCVPMAFIELTEEYKGSTEVMEYIKKICSENLKEYERPKIFTEIDKIPHKQNGGKEDFLLLEKMAEEYVNENKKVLSLK